MCSVWSTIKNGHLFSHLFTFVNNDVRSLSGLPRGEEDWQWKDPNQRSSRPCTKTLFEWLLTTLAPRYRFDLAEWLDIMGIKLVPDLERDWIVTPAIFSVSNTHIP